MEFRQVINFDELAFETVLTIIEHCENETQDSKLRFNQEESQRLLSSILQRLRQSQDPHEEVEKILTWYRGIVLGLNVGESGTTIWKINYSRIEDTEHAELFLQGFAIGAVLTKPHYKSNPLTIIANGLDKQILSHKPQIKRQAQKLRQRLKNQ